MRLRNGEHGYGVVTKFLHWVTVAAIAGQFAVGWTMDAAGSGAEPSPVSMRRLLVCTRLCW